jgi:hypothetical protein
VKLFIEAHIQMMLKGELEEDTMAGVLQNPVNLQLGYLLTSSNIVFSL